MSRIENKVMASVALIHTWRRATSARALKVYGLIVGIVALRELTYMRQVVYNMLDAEGVSGLLTFVANAFLATELSVQFAFLATAIVASLFLRDVFGTTFRRRSLASA